MLGWIWVWEDKKNNLHLVKVMFGNLRFYLRVLSATPLDYNRILENKKIYRNTCSRQDKNLGEPDYKDYRDFSLLELSRIIFIEAPKEERLKRETEWEGIRSYYRRELPKEIDLDIYWYPNRFDIYLPSIDLTFYYWKRLSQRKNKRKPKNVISWFESAKDTGDSSNYQRQPFGTHYTVDLPSLIWWLGNYHKEKLLWEMFGLT